MIQRSDRRYGPESVARLDAARAHDADGARAALETFYYALNHRDAETLRASWTADELAQLNNPLGGILHGGDAIAGLYERIFAGPVRLEVTFGEVVEYLDADHAVFAGREHGHYAVGDGAEVPLTIRTTRYLRYADGRWAQFHHHGSIDDADELRAYQRAVLGG